MATFVKVKRPQGKVGYINLDWVAQINPITSEVSQIVYHDDAIEQVLETPEGILCLAHLAERGDNLIADRLEELKMALVGIEGDTIPDAILYASKRGR